MTPDEGTPAEPVSGVNSTATAMTPGKGVHVRSIDEFLRTVAIWRTAWGCRLTVPPKCDPHYGAFRGQGDWNWLLRSKAARLPEEIDGLTGAEIEHELFHAWRKRAAVYRKGLAFNPRDDWEWLACAQHHGLVTRLLDWTMNPLYALYFSCLQECPDKDATIWGLKASAIPQLVPSEVPINEDAPLLDSSTNVWLYLPRRDLTTRLTAQQGCFTVQAKGMLDLPDALRQEPGRLKSCMLTSAVLPAEYKASVITELHERGIDYESLFPEPDGLARTINREYSVETNT